MKLYLPNKQTCGRYLLPSPSSRHNPHLISRPGRAEAKQPKTLKDRGPTKPPRVCLVPKLQRPQTNLSLELLHHDTSQITQPNRFCFLDLESSMKPESRLNHGLYWTLLGLFGSFLFLFFFCKYRVVTHPLTPIICRSISARNIYCD